MHNPVAGPGDNASMHDKRQAQIDTPNSDERPLESMIAELETGEPATAADVADEIAARLEAQLAAASASSSPSEPVAERLPFIVEAVDSF